MAEMNQEIKAEEAPPSGEDDVAGHSFGVTNPTIARELGRAREQDIERDMARARGQGRTDSASRGSLLGAIRRVGRRSRTRT
jgi:hypothetical protein